MHNGESAYRAQAEGKAITVFVGLCDEHLACKGGSFVRAGDERLMSELQAFNRSQDFAALRAALAKTVAAVQ